MLMRCLCLLAGAALMVIPACGGGGSTGDDGVHVLSASAVSHISPDCGGGGTGGDD
jgi:hypothetical protein